MGKIIKNTNKVAISAAIDMLASNPGIRYKDVGEKLGYSATTITNWMCSPVVIDRVYKRYMELAGNELPAVVQAIIEEAKLGNVHAARLILEHFGKLENKIKVQVESNFEKFMKGDDTEEAEFFEVTESQEEVLEILSDSNIKLPERHSSNDFPKARDEFEKNRLKYKINEKQKNEEEIKRQSERYLIRKRAKLVDLDLLPPGRHTKTARDQWMRKLIQLESEKGE